MNGQDGMAGSEELYNCAYEPGQWTRSNPEGRKKYGRRFLLLLRTRPISLEKPACLRDREDLKDIIMEEHFREQECPLCIRQEQDEKSVTDKRFAEKKTAEDVGTEVAYVMEPLTLLTAAAKEVTAAKKPLGTAAYLLLNLRKITVVEFGSESEEKESLFGCNGGLWTPQNPNGKRKYDRELLLKLHSHPISLLKPENLKHVEITLEKDTSKHERCHVCDLEESLELPSVVAKQRVNDFKLLFLV